MDSLTGLANRRRFDSYTRGRMENLEKDASLYLLMLDINNFKGINDTFGHTQGDQVLVMTARTLLRASEGVGAFTARIGGDEFVIVMCNTSLQQVERMTDKIGKYMQEENKIAGKKYTVSLAIGYAGMKGSDEISLETLFDLADKNMYANKRRREERLKDDSK